MTLEQAQALCDKLKASANGELSDDALEAVAGGSIADAARHWYDQMVEQMHENNP